MLEKRLSCIAWLENSPASLTRVFTLCRPVMNPSIRLPEWNSRSPRAGMNSVEDAIRESKGMVRFLNRRMFENYLLNSAAIARLFNEAGGEHGLRAAEAIIHSQLIASP